MSQPRLLVLVHRFFSLFFPHKIELNKKFGNFLILAVISCRNKAKFSYVIQNPDPCLTFIPTHLHRTKLWSTELCAPDWLNKCRRDNQGKSIYSWPENKKFMRTNLWWCQNSALALVKCLCEKQGKWLS